LYDATQQNPKNDQEFSDFYGGDRRQVNRYSVFCKFNRMQFVSSYFIYRLISVLHVTVVVQASIVLRFKKAPNLLVHDLFVGVVLNHIQKIE
jgi:hypothetical protein